MNVAKRLVMGAVVLGVFIVYSLGIRHELPRIGKPASLAKSPAETPAPSTGGGGNPAPAASNGSSPASAPAANGQYRDGAYTGSVADAFYGSVQVEATIAGGKLTSVKFLQYPDTHQTSIDINQQAMLYLEQEAIQAQSAQVNTVTGATFTSQAFVQSLSSALAQA